MKSRMSKTLKFWVDVECEHRKHRVAGESKQAFVAEILHEWEELGEAMRYLRPDGKIGWKATPRMRNRLADAERDAKDELDEWE
jgi:hypothetical protein